MYCVALLSKVNPIQWYLIMSTKNYICLAVFLATILLIEDKGGWEDLQARSNCLDGASAEDQALWEKVAVVACTPAARNWFEHAYQISPNDWFAYGYNDQCNIALPYAKTLNSAYLVLHGLTDSNMKWHSTIDYRATAEATNSLTHYRFSYAPSSDRSGWLALSDFQTNRVWLSCLLFDFNSGSNNPATRAGDFMHEAWHYWQLKNNILPEHMIGPVGYCDEYGPACDWYYPHRLRDFQSSYHIWLTGTASDGRLLFHSPNQVQIEFLCDLAEHAADFVPKIVRDLAKAEANLRIDGKIRNIVAYHCGDPRPW